MERREYWTEGGRGDGQGEMSRKIISHTGDHIGRGKKM